MCKFGFFVVAIEVDRQVPSKVIRYSKLIPARVLEALSIPKVVFGHWNGNGPSGAISEIGRDTESFGCFVKTHQTHIVWLIEVGVEPVVLVYLIL